MDGGPAEDVDGAPEILASDSPRADTPSASKRAASVGLLDAGTMDESGLDALQLRSAAPSTSAPSPAPMASADDDAAMNVSPSPRPPVPEPAEQLATIGAARRSEMQAGQDWVIVDRQWFRRFEAACAGGSTADKDLADITPADVGPLTNGLLTDAEGNLRVPPPVEDVDCVFLPLSAWEKLRDWYGSSSPPLVRKTVARGNNRTVCLELFAPCISIGYVIAPNATGPPPGRQAVTDVRLSAASPASLLREAIKARVGVERPMRVWTAPRRLSEPEAIAEHTEDTLTVAGDRVRVLGYALALTEHARDDGQTLGELDMGEAEVHIVVEEQTADGDWLVADLPPVASTQQGPPQLGSAGGTDFFSQKAATTSSSIMGPKGIKLIGPTRPPTASTSKPSPSMTTRSQASTSSAPRTAGLTGLSNLGNTCFMNSALQCLSNTPELRRYFTSPVWRSEINADNPLGMSGKVAEQFGALMGELWSNRSGSSVSPTDFKRMIGKFRPMFLGWSQQDSQELLAFLLDGLHEDLNRIKQKPSYETPDFHTGTDAEMVAHANKSWAQYKTRNDSVIVDLFQGQYRNTMECLECGQVSVKFDEVMYITVSLPKVPWRFDIWWVPLDPAGKRLVTIQVPTDSSMRDVKARMATLMDVPASRIVTVEYFSRKVWKWVRDSDLNSSVQGNDVLVMWEVAFDYAQPGMSDLQSYNRPKGFVPDAERDAKNGHIVVPIVFAIAESAAESRGLKLPFNARSPNLFGQPCVLSATCDAATSYEDVYQRVCDIVYNNADQPDAMLIDELQSDAPADDAAASPSPAADPSASAMAIDSAIDGAQPTSRYRPNLFQIYVQSQPGDMLAGRSTEDKADISLKQRAKAWAQKSEADEATAPASQSMPGAFVRGEDENFDGPDAPLEVETVEEPPVASTSSEPAPSNEPIIRSGDVLVLRFGAAAHKALFANGGKFDVADKFADPAIEAYNNKSGRQLSLDQCLVDFTKTERLDPDNLWKCCDKLQENADKTMALWKLPDILVVHLKRFSNAGRYGSKITDFVDFPTDGWDLTDRVEGRRAADRIRATAEGQSVLSEDDDTEPLVYDLFAVDNHFGGLGGGHYTAYAKNEIDQQWHNYDDSRVSPAKESDIKSSAAYLLFYRRRSSRPLGGKTMSIIAAARGGKAEDELVAAPPSLKVNGSMFADLTTPSAMAVDPLTGAPPTPPDSDDGNGVRGRGVPLSHSNIAQRFGLPGMRETSTGANSIAANDASSDDNDSSFRGSSAAADQMDTDDPGYPFADSPARHHFYHTEQDLNEDLYSPSDAAAPGGFIREKSPENEGVLARYYRTGRVGPSASAFAEGEDATGHEYADVTVTQPSAADSPGAHDIAIDDAGDEASESLASSGVLVERPPPSDSAA